jgi:hypothetical protein
LIKHPVIYQPLDQRLPTRDRIHAVRAAPPARLVGFP